MYYRSPRWAPPAAHGGLWARRWAAVVKNEITAHAVGTMSVYPDVRTIFEIGGQDSKIILIENGFMMDYAMNTLCVASAAQ